MFLDWAPAEAAQVLLYKVYSQCRLQSIDVTSCIPIYAGQFEYLISVRFNGLSMMNYEMTATLLYLASMSSSPWAFTILTALVTSL